MTRYATIKINVVLTNCTENYAHIFETKKVVTYPQHPYNITPAPPLLVELK